MTIATNFNFEWRNFTFKEAQSREELNEALALRFNVFERELYGSLSDDYITELDDYDNSYNHILMYDKISSILIGCCRIVDCTQAVATHVSDQFDLSGLDAHEYALLEVDKFCIRSSYRNNVTLTAFGHAIHHLASELGITHICSSISMHHIDEDEHRSLQSYLLKKHKTLSNDAVHPFDDAFDHTVEQSAPTENFEHIEIPALLEAYLLAGAQISLRPAYNQHFACADYFTILDLKEAQGIFSPRLIS